MVNENEFKFKLINFDLDSANDISQYILKYADLGKIKVSSVIIKKDGNSVFISANVEVIIKNIVIPIIEKSINYILEKHRIRDEEKVKYEMEKLKEKNKELNNEIGKYREILDFLDPFIDKIFNGTKNEENASAMLQYSHLEVIIKNGVIDQIRNIPDSPKRKGKICPICGTKNPERAKFCMECGTKL